MGKLVRKGWIEKSREPLSISKLQDYLTDIFKERYSNNTKFTGWTHHVWEEDGQQFSMWCCNGMCTGDGGFALYQEALKKEINKFINTNESDSTGINKE